MKKKTRLLSWMMVGAMTLAGLVGCGGGNNATPEAETESAATSEEANADSAEGVEEAQEDSAGKTYTIGYVNLADTDQFCVARKDALSKAIKGSNFKINFADANNDIQMQLDLANNFIAQKVDILVLVPVDFSGISPAVEKANEAGIPVICMGIKSEGGEYTYVGSENFDAGHMQGEFMAENLPENAKILYLAGTAGLDHAKERREGFYAALEEAGRADIETLDDQDGDYVMDKGMEITENWIQSFPEFNAIIASNDQMALGAIEALKASNRLEGVLITGIDGVAEAVAAIKSGEMAQSVLQNATGQAEACLDVMKKLTAGETPEKEVMVPFVSITKENVTDFE